MSRARRLTDGARRGGIRRASKSGGGGGECGGGRRKGRVGKKKKKRIAASEPGVPFFPGALYFLDFLTRGPAKKELNGKKANELVGRAGLWRRRRVRHVRPPPAFGTRLSASKMWRRARASKQFKQRAGNGHTGGYVCIGDLGVCVCWEHLSDGCPVSRVRYGNCAYICVVLVTCTVKVHVRWW